MACIWALECGQQAEGQHLQLSLHLKRAKVSTLGRSMFGQDSVTVLHSPAMQCASGLEQLGLCSCGTALPPRQRQQPLSNMTNFLRLAGMAMLPGADARSQGPLYAGIWLHEG